MQRQQKISIFVVKPLSFDQSLTRFEHLTKFDQLWPIDYPIRDWHATNCFLSRIRVLLPQVHLWWLLRCIFRQGYCVLHWWHNSFRFVWLPWLNCRKCVLCTNLFSCSDEVAFSSLAKVVVVSAVQLRWRCLDDCCALRAGSRFQTVFTAIDEGVNNHDTSIETPSRRITKSMSRGEPSIPSPLSLFCITLVWIPLYWFLVDLFWLTCWLSPKVDL